MTKPIKIAVVGIGNCTSSLLQGIEYYKKRTAGKAIGIMHWFADENAHQMLEPIINENAPAIS